MKKIELPKSISVPLDRNTPKDMDISGWTPEYTLAVLVQGARVIVQRSAAGKETAADRKAAREAAWVRLQSGSWRGEREVDTLLEALAAEVKAATGLTTKAARDAASQILQQEPGVRTPAAARLVAAAEERLAAPTVGLKDLF